MIHIKTESQIEPLHRQLGGAKEVHFSVTHARNLQLRVRATGAKTWLYRKQTSGRRSRMSLGSWLIITLAKAISKAAELNAQAYDGKAIRATLAFGEVVDIWTDRKALSGNDLLEPCREYEKHNAGQAAAGHKTGHCMGFISGVVWASPDDGCWPAGANLGQAILIVIKYLKENPAQLHRAAGYLVEETLREAWPCPK